MSLNKCRNCGQMVGVVNKTIYACPCQVGRTIDFRFYSVENAFKFLQMPISAPDISHKSSLDYLKGV